VFEAVFRIAFSRQVLDANFLKDLSVLVRYVNISAGSLGKLTLSIQKVDAKIRLHKGLFSLYRKTSVLEVLKNGKKYRISKDFEE
jgi:hypothetical protein